MYIFQPELRTTLFLNDLPRNFRVSDTLVQTIRSQSVSFVLLGISLVIGGNLLSRKQRRSLLAIVLMSATGTNISQSVTNRTLIIFSLYVRTADMDLLFALLESMLTLVDFLFLKDGG
jgi:hypothetical protein